MPVLSDKDKAQIQKLFEQSLKKDVHIRYVTTDAPSCQFCSLGEELYREVSSLNEKVKLEVIQLGTPEAETLGITDKAPVTDIGTADGSLGIRYFGLPSGYEFTAFLEDIVMVSKGTSGLSEVSLKILDQVDSPMRILVFVTPTCPYCPRAVRVAHQMAMAKPGLIVGDMVEALEFPNWADEYQVSAVPKNVVLSKEGLLLREFEGALPEDAFIQACVMGPSSVGL